MYESPIEHRHRFNVFRGNLDRIMQHNSASNGDDIRLAMNHFGDLSEEEYRAYLSTHVPDFSHASGVFKRTGASLPDTVDWRDKGAVTPVKNQGQCGSCWSFSTTGSLEGAHQIATGNLVSLSEQNLVDCSGKYGNEGCNGGLMPWAFEYIINNGGIDTEACYPYTGRDGTCKYKSSCIGATMKSYVNVTSGDENALAEALANVGPVSVAIDASSFQFQFYSSGVYKVSNCKNKFDDLDHGVLAVGYGTENGQAYWLVKNSWGSSWGLSGYIKMARNYNNMCGIATCASYPVV